MRNVLTILKKELRRFFTDRRMLLTLILPGVILYFVYSLMGSFIGSMFTGEEDKKYRVAINENTTVTQTVFDSIGLDYELIDGLLEENALEKLKNGEVDLVVFAKAEHKDQNGQTLPSVEVYYDSTSPDSTAIYTAFYSVASQLAFEVKPIFYLNAFKPSYDVAS